jgi:rhodanese-related sulfurtransferase
VPGFGQIRPDHLIRLLGLPNAPVIFDVRLAEDIAADPHVVPTARLIPHHAIAALADPPGRAVVVCKRGAKLSEGAAAHLRAKGWQAEVLEGGNLAWAAAGLPRVPLAALPPTTVWVTRHRPKIDRIACPWLIRRFIDPGATFLFVAPDQVMAVAEHFAATPFDIPGVTLTHRGDGCTFDALIDDFALHSPALERLALVVRAADTDRHHLAPQAAGLLALSVGLSRMCRDDLEQLEHGLTIYDALYRWARDGFDEGHDWPEGRMP